MAKDLIRMAALPIPAWRGPLWAPGAEESQGDTQTDADTEQTSADGEENSANSAKELEKIREELERAREELGLSKREQEALTRRVQAAREVADPGDDPEETAKAMYTVLTEVVGMSEAEARSRVRQLQGGEEDEDEDRTPRRRPAPTSFEDKQARAEVEQMRRELQQQELRRLEQETQSELKGALDSSGEVAKLLEQVRSNKKDPSKLQASMRRDADAQMRQILRDRVKRSGGSWDDNWIPDAAAKAVKAVADRLTQAIDALSVDTGRSPETDAGLEYLTKTKPLTPPTEDDLGRKGNDKVLQEARAWAVDKVMRSVADGRRTKV